MRLAVLRRAWYRIDWEPPGAWSWTPYPMPRGRFDSASGALRVRYAADSQRGAMRERFDGQGRVVSAAQLDAYLLEITGAMHVLDLRKDRTLDALGLDDQISTSRAPGPWRACQRLTDLAVEWFGASIHGIVYRSRTTPEHGANAAILAHAPIHVRSLGRLRDSPALLTACVTGDGFAFESWA